MASRSRVDSKKLPRKRVLKEEVQEEEVSSSLFREGMSILLVVVSIFLFLSLNSYLSSPEEQALSPSMNLMGKLGFLLSNRLFEYLGYCGFSVVGITVLVACLLWRNSDENQQISPERILLIGSFILLFIVSFAILSSTLLGYEGGGYIGSTIAFKLDSVLNKAGTVLMSFALIAISLAVIVNLRIKHYIRAGSLLWSGAQRTAIEGTTVIKRGMQLGGAVLEKTPNVLAGRNKNLELDEDVEDEEEEFVLDSKPKRARRAKKVKKIKDETEFELGEELEEEEQEEEFLLEEAEGEIAPPLISRGESKSHKVKRVGALNKKKSKEPVETKERLKKSYNSKRDYNSYQIPPREILVGLDGASLDGPKDEELIQNSKRLEQALRNFKLGGRVVEVHPGPVVTLYQFEPAAGIKVQRIINLADDLALALKVESVRVYAPVPGKGTIGIEVPNAVREIVRLRDIVDSEEYQTKNYALSLALGKDTYGEAFVADLAKMPHLLIAGATGTGKSVCINSLLMSLLYKSSPQDLRLILIDPKMLELSIYEGIPHLLSPVITNPKRAKGVLYWAVEEMERRYSLMKDLGVRDLAMYNRMIEKGGDVELVTNRKKKDEIIKLEEKDVVSTTAAQSLVDRDAEHDALSAAPYEGLSTMSRIVIVVDELADLMLTVGKEIEELLTRLAQKARACGIHLILATQRPSVNVITGLIKANFPARISFKVTSKIDARTILDVSGSERLLGQGDMLFLSPVIGRMKRLHSPFVSDQEVHDVVNWIRDQGEPDYDPMIEKTLNLLEEQEKAQSNPTEGFDVDGEDYDPLYDQAVNLVIEKGQASTSMVQRVFRIGYNRAARILETMEREGLVGPADGAKPRQVIGGGASGPI
jgi:S-DNA-T family DNA segregation ATPase FtsK/SpoIIIE